MVVHIFMMMSLLGDEMILLYLITVYNWGIGFLTLLSDVCKMFLIFLGMAHFEDL